MLLRTAICAAALACAAAERAVSTASRRSLASAGCHACCFENDCHLAFSMTSPGVCCGSHRIRGQTGCCPYAPRPPFYLRLGAPAR